VSEGRVGIGFGAGRLRGVFAAQPVDMVELLGRLIVGFEGVVPDRPAGRDAIRMAYFAEVAIPQPQQYGAIDLAVAAHEVMKSRVKRLPVGTVPGLLGLVAGIDEHRLSIPVLAFARQIAAALQKQNALARPGETPGHGSAAGSGSNDDHVVWPRIHDLFR